VKPEPSPACTHPDDEWCDDCFIPARHLVTLRSTDAAATDPYGPLRTALATAAQDWPRWVDGQLRWACCESTIGPLCQHRDPLGLINEGLALEAERSQAQARRVRQPCVNGRHTLHSVRLGASCDRPLPPPPFQHRAVGQIALWGTLGVLGAGVLGWKVAERAAEAWSTRQAVRAARAAWAAQAADIRAAYTGSGA